MYTNSYSSISKKQRKQPAANYEYFYADFECDVSNPVHVPSYVACIKRGTSENEMIEFFGPTCQQQLCEYLPDNSVLYFHNLGYDVAMFSQTALITGAIDKGSKIISQTIKYKGKKILLRDTYALISSPLSAFPKMFNLKTGDKEVCPYMYLTNKLLQTGVGIISEAGKQEKKCKWNQQRFEQNIAKHHMFVNEDGSHSETKTNYFDAKAYLSFYCKQDVLILANGFDKFRQLTLDAVKIDVDEVLTISSLAQKYFEREVYLKAKNYYKYSGIIREYIQGAVVGGRTMTRDNFKWLVQNTELYDFDARSLYPSAMHRAWIQTGKPIVLTEEECDLKYLLSHTCAENEQPSSSKPISMYVVDIEITKLEGKYSFPLFCLHDDKGNNLYTNDVIGKTVRISNIRLEDYCKYYSNFDCKIIRGYKWIDNKDFTIQTVIKNLYDLRNSYKKQGNPIEQIYKLIMNSAYGKTCQKPIMTEKKYFEFTIRKYLTKKDIEKLDADKEPKFNEHGQRMYKGYVLMNDENGKQFYLDHPLNKFKIKNSEKITDCTRIGHEILHVFII